jgi:amphi-Trp domain-containing protein
VVIGRKLSMGKETVLFKSEEKKSSSDIANTLRQIADKIDDGTMILKQGSEEITLEFPKNMVLELKIEEEQGKKKLKKSFEIELEWVIGDEQAGSTSIL